MDNYIKIQIENTISSFQQLPYLFVGTGLSMRYSHAPSWNGLLYDIWKIVNPDKKERDFEKLKQKIEMDVNSKFTDLSTEEQKYYVNPILATNIEKDFCSLYYSSDSFDITVFTDYENDDIISHRYNPFKYYVSKKLGEIVLDRSLPDYNTVLIGQDSLLVANTLNIFEIFKIHGCSSCPNSIILDETDYENFDKRLKYLSAKLLTIFVEHPIIFIGYGLGDVNIRKLFYEIAECLTTEQLEKIKDNFIFISPAFGGKESFGKREIIFDKHSIIINEFILNDYSVVYQSLSKIQSSMPIKLARKLQNMVCNYVYSAEAQNNILFGDIDSPDIDDDKAAVYFGKVDTVTQMGFSYFNIDEILEDVLFNNKPYLINPQLIEKTFKNIRSSAGSTPIYKYISKLNYPLNSIPKNYNIIDGYDDTDIKPTSTDIKSYIKKGTTFNCIADIEKCYPDHIPKQAANIKKFARNISTDELEIYLKKYFYTDIYKKYKSLFRKLIALYDYKRYA